LIPSKKIAALISCVLATALAFPQTAKFSLATDLSVLHSFKKGQRYWAIGQTVNFHFHITSRDGAYAWISYYSNGRFSNDLAATAKQSSTQPQELGYRNSTLLRFKHISLGWERYLAGSPSAEKGFCLYSYAGFGLMIGTIQNTHSQSIDTSLYNVPVREGKANFKRLTFDLGLGFEFPAGGDVFLYFEGRVLVPTTDYPSKYLFINRNAPFTGAANTGVRILFN
jgi:hypothetical protein